jgi:hypothetical protein
MQILRTISTFPTTEFSIFMVEKECCVLVLRVLRANRFSFRNFRRRGRAVSKL